MKFDNFLNKFKIPTLLGLALIIAGIVAGVFLVVKDQPFFTKASADLTPQNITLSNITDTEITVSWQTQIETPSFLTFGERNGSEKTVLDERDSQTPTSRLLHFVTIKDLLPETRYMFKIITGPLTSDTKEFTTANSASFQNGYGPIIGSVFKESEPLEEAIAYLSISDAAVQSGLVKNMGNFLIPISLMRKGDLSDTFAPEENAIGKLTVISTEGQSNISFNIKSSGTQLPPVKIGENIDLTSDVSESTTNEPKINRFDLNGDGEVNAVDYSEILMNFGKNPKNPKADVNGDGIVDNEDLLQLSAELGVN